MPATNPLRIDRFAGKRIFHEKTSRRLSCKSAQTILGSRSFRLIPLTFGSGNLLIFLTLRDPHDLTVLAWHMLFLVRKTGFTKIRKTDPFRIGK
jgi:hypothetical protein